MIPIEIYGRILPYLVEENKYGYDRVENIGLWTRIAQVCKHFQIWTFSAEGPFKLTKTVPIPLTQCPKILRCFMGTLNRKKVAQVEAAFKYLEAPDDYPEKSALAGVYPLATNFQGQSLLNRAFEKMQDEKNMEGVLKLFFNRLSPAVFFSHFSWSLNCSHLIRLLELFYNETASELPREVFIWFYARLSNSKNGGLFIEWAQKKGIKFDIEILSSGCFSFYEWRTYRTAISNVEKILDIQPEIILQTNSKGMLLIHYYLNFIEAFQSIVKRCPDTLKAKDGHGRSIIFYILKKDQNISFPINGTSEFYWDVREDVFEGILNSHRNLRDDFPFQGPYYIEYAWNKIMSAFSEKADFQKWLTTPYGKDHKSFVHELIVRSHYLAGRLMKDHEDIAIIQGTDYEAIKAQFIKYPGLKDFFHFDLFYQMLQLEEKEPALFKLDALFDSNWITYIQENGDTVLHQLFSASPKFYFRMKKSTEIFAYMLDRGFDPDVKNKAGKLVLDLMKKNKWDDYLHLFS